jgi:hypothetical protein
MPATTKPQTVPLQAEWPQRVWTIRVETPKPAVGWSPRQAAVFVGLWCVLGREDGRAMRGQERHLPWKLEQMRMAFASTDDPETTPLGRILAAQVGEFGMLDLTFQPANDMTNADKLLRVLFSRLRVVELWEVS